MLRKLASVGLAVSALSLGAFAQNGHYESGGDYLLWSPTVPHGLAKFAGADFTRDDIDDAIALHAGSLYLVHAPAMFARWELLATGVTDFVVANRHGVQGAIFSDATGLKFAFWGDTTAVVTPIVAGPSWANLPLLTTTTDQLGTVWIAGKLGVDAIKRGRWEINDTWTSLAPVKSAASSMVYFDYTLSAAGMELALLVNGSLQIRSESGNPLAVPSLPATTAHQIFRNPHGGNNGRDSLIYVAQSTAFPASLETIQEVFWEGAATPLETGPWQIGQVVPAHPWLNGTAGVIVQAVSATTMDVFRFEDLGATENTLTLVLSTNPGLFEDYWHIPVTAEQLGGTPPPAITDGLLACGDFDADGLDDVFIASELQRHSYFYPAWDDEFRTNGIGNIQFPTPGPDAAAGPGSARDSARGGRGSAGTDTTVQLGIQCTVATLPRGFSGAVNGLEVAAFVRLGGLSSFISLPYKYYTVKDVTSVVGPASVMMYIDVPTGTDLSQTLCYVHLRAVRADFSGTQPVILQRSTPVTCVTVLDQQPIQNPLLCSLFDVEPDPYSEEESQNNQCLSSDGPVILGGYSRRANLGPLPVGSGSPVP